MAQSLYWKRCRVFILIGAMFCLFLCVQARAETPPPETNIHENRNELTPEQRKKLARSFLTRMKSGINQADSYLANFNIVSGGEENILPEGEGLLIQPLLFPGLRVDGLISGTVRNQKILLSLADFSSVLQLPITIDVEKQTASGWYIRENKEFLLDMSNKIARTDHGEFALSQAVIFENGDFFIDSKELAKWFDFDVKLDISAQEIEIKSKIPLPIQERYERRKIAFIESRNLPPSLPERELPYKAMDTPFVDVSTNSTYRRDNDETEGQKYHNVNIATSGDLAYGTVETQSLLDNRDQLRSFRANYRRESDQPDLLGKLKARKFAVGDVVTARLPIGSASRQELGVSVTNRDPLSGSLSPTTSISGNAFPGWDVELYRDSQLVSFQEVGDDGFYQFDNVVLFRNDNKFRVVFYGPQGEVVEEDIFVPVDPSRLAEGTGVYDVSLTLDNKQTYLKRDFRPQDQKTSPNLAASYERAIIPGTTASVGFRTNESNEQRDYVANAGVATIALETLFNADVAVDDEGEVLSEFVARRSFGEHDFSNKLSWTGEGFDSQSGGENVSSLLENNLNISGPIPIGLGRSPRYNANLRYAEDGEGENTFNSGLGFSTSWRSFTLNQDVRYSKTELDIEKVQGSTNVTGTYGRNRMRVGTIYDINPETELMRVLANYRRYINKDLDFEAEWSKNVPEALSEYTAKLDWQAGFIRISPRVSYNSEQDFFAGLSTRFGILREPHNNDVKVLGRNLTANGGLSAFVYLDKNGDSVFNEGDEPIPDIVIQTPQNGGRETTDAQGIALFSRMRETKLTDVFIDTETLPDPSWVSGFEGISVLPRAGYIASVEFPVHLAGEIDGIVYLNGPESQPLKNIPISLYNVQGKPEQTVVTDISGFYYFTRVPPGRYLMIVDEKSAQRGNFIRPEPKAIEIGYDGTVLYGTDIVVDPGEGDVPSEIMADLEDYKTRHSHIDFSKDNYDLVLNLGDYNSNVLMSVIWYKIKTRYAPIMANSKIFVPPSESYADTKTGKHTLRVGLSGESIDGAYRRCRSLMARDLYCKVEIYPAYMKQARAEIIPVPETAQP